MTFVPRIAYFSMEIGHSADMPTYSGGLGVLAGDTISAAADVNLPMVAVALVHRQGYFRQVLDDVGNQREEPDPWPLPEYLRETPARAMVSIEGRAVAIRAWTYDIAGVQGHRVPVILLDTNLPENSEYDRTLTDFLYGGDPHYRLCQEVVLGMGGVRILRALGYHKIQRFHANEGHAALLMVELLMEQLKREGREAPTPADIEAVRNQCVFTTHTPVPAGHDRFPIADVNRVLKGKESALLRTLPCVDDWLNMTQLALHFSHYVNGVSQRHGEVSRQLFPGQAVDAITNGVHARTWVAPAFRELFDRFVPRWLEDPFSLRHALRIPYLKVLAAHNQSKQRLFDYVKAETDVELDPNTFTIGFARRTAAYKRAGLLFDDLDRLRRITKHGGALQLVYAGKAHPHDHGAKELIRTVFQAGKQLGNDIRLVYLADYDIDVCRLMTAGVDLWLNTPEPPLEASGTSGMKAALNGVPSLSVLDGWWVEGCIENVTGWAIGTDAMEAHEVPSREATGRFLYDKLEYVILPMFYRESPRYVDIMKHCIAVNGAYFTTRRMVLEYMTRAYLSHPAGGC